jgi:hypothetical protein
VQHIFYSFLDSGTISSSNTQKQTCSLTLITLEIIFLLIRCLRILEYPQQVYNKHICITYNLLNNTWWLYDHAVTSRKLQLRTKYCNNQIYKSISIKFLQGTCTIVMRKNKDVICACCLFWIFLALFWFWFQQWLNFGTSRHNHKAIEYCSKYCNKCVYCKLVAGDLKILKQWMRRNILSRDINARKQVCFCIFDNKVVPESRRG